MKFRVEYLFSSATGWGKCWNFVEANTSAEAINKVQEKHKSKYKFGCDDYFKNYTAKQVD